MMEEQNPLAISFSNKLFDYIAISAFFDLSIRPTIIGYEKCPRNKGKITYSKSVFTFHFVLRGKGCLLLNDGTKQEVGPRQCFLLTPECGFTYFPLPSDPWEYLWIEFSGDSAKSLCRNILFPPSQILTLDCFDEVITHFKALFDIRQKGLKESALNLAFSSEVLSIFSLLLAEHGKDEKISGKTAKEAEVHQIVLYLEANYTNPDLSMKQVADHFYFSQAYLTRLFKSVVGISPVKYVTDLRMQSACSFLTQRSLTISQISSAIGYRNAFYFSKEFKTYFATTPTAYRNETKKS